jgi:hypothetical protein
MAIVFSGLLGGFLFNGAGVFIGHFSPFVVFAALGTETGGVSAREGEKEERREGGRGKDWELLRTFPPPRRRQP